MLSKFYNMLTIFTIDLWREDVESIIRSDQTVKPFLNGPINLTLLHCTTDDSNKGLQLIREKLLALCIPFDIWVCREQENVGIVFEGRNGSEVITSSVNLTDYEDMVKQMRCIFAPNQKIDSKKANLLLLSKKLSLPEPLLVETQLQFYINQALFRKSSSPLCSGCNIFIQRLLDADRMNVSFKNEELINPFE